MAPTRAPPVTADIQRMIAEQLAADIRELGWAAQAHYGTTIAWVHVPIEVYDDLKIVLRGGDIQLTQKVRACTPPGGASEIPLGTWELADPDCLDELWVLISSHLQFSRPNGPQA